MTTADLLTIHVVWTLLCFAAIGACLETLRRRNDEFLRQVDGAYWKLHNLAVHVRSLGRVVNAHDAMLDAIRAANPVPESAPNPGPDPGENPGPDPAPESAPENGPDNMQARATPHNIFNGLAHKSTQKIPDPIFAPEKVAEICPEKRAEKRAGISAQIMAFPHRPGTSA